MLTAADIPARHVFIQFWGLKTLLEGYGSLEAVSKAKLRLVAAMLITRSTVPFLWAFTKIAKRAGLKLRLHDLRHTHATLMLKSGVHPKIVSERLGHATVAFTLGVYSHMLWVDCKKRL